MNCLKCGRTIPDNDLLCPACRKEGAAAPAVRRNQFPARAEASGEQGRAKPKPKPEVVLRHRVRRLHRLLAAALCLALLLAAASGTLWLLLRQSQAEQRSAQESLQQTQGELSDADEALGQTRQLLNDAEEKLAQQSDIISAFEAYTGRSAAEIAADAE